MKINWNNRYTTIAVYTIIILIVGIAFLNIISELDVFATMLGRQLSFFQPIIMGLVMAYLFNFILEFAEKKILIPKAKFKREKKITRITSLAITYIIVFLLVYLFLYFILPELIASIVGLANDIPTYITNISRLVTDLMNRFHITDEVNILILERWNEFMDNLVNFSTGLIPLLGTTVRTIFSSIWNVAIGLIISIYLLFDKERYLALSRKVTIALFPDKAAKKTLELTKRADNIFGKFLSGKIIDSVIIGFLTFVILSITNMPFKTLVSFIIGVTNIIPFFGPFIGAIPSFFLILFISPVKALWFLLIVVIIQQIDGNIIGPKILGDSLGISPFWILFSILVAGKLLGFIGMVLGVPLFVFIYSILKEFMEVRLEKKGLPTETKDYYEL